MRRSALLAAAVLAGLLVIAAGRRDAGGQPPRATTLLLPNGTYTAIVVTATGVFNANPASAVLRVGNDQFLINVAAGTTVSIPFGNGWDLKDDAEITLTPGAGTIGAAPSAWAITPEGPRRLRPR